MSIIPMSRFNVFVTPTAKEDIDNLYDFIISEHKSLNTANRYIDGIENTINRLALYAELFRTQRLPQLSPLQGNIRRINYKKMAILYTVANNNVYVLRVIPAATIAE
jgi:plasmid stabilization system protein ParE